MPILVMISWIYHPAKASFQSLSWKSKQVWYAKLITCDLSVTVCLADIMHIMTHPVSISYKKLCIFASQHAGSTAVFSLD